MKVVIMGAGRAGALLAESLAVSGNAVTVIEKDRRQVANLPRARVDAGAIEIIEGDASTAEILEAAGTGEADLFIAASGSDTLNGLVAQKAKSMFRVKMTAASVKDEGLQHLYESLGIITVNPTRLAADQLLTAIEMTP